MRFRCPRMMAWAFWIAWLIADAAAQAPVSPDLSSDAARVASVESLRQREESQAARARQAAAQFGWAVRGQSGDGAQYELIGLEGPAPRYYITANANAAISTAANLIRNTAPYNVNGAGWIIGLWDAGSARTTHQEFGARVQSLDGAAIHSHSTHVAGTLAAAGVQSAAMGMAPSANVDSYDWNSDASEMTARGATAPGQSGRIYLSSHSYAIITGWEYGDFSGTFAQHWWGAWGESEDRDFGRYGSYASQWDAIAYAAPYYLIFKAAANDRNDPPPASGETFYYLSGSNWVSKNYNAATDPAGDGVANGGYDTIPGDGIGKNLVTVAAVNDAVSGGTRSLAGATMTAFSSWGPADDGRVKPDLSGNGASLYSTYSTSDSSYASSSGTSMATPNVAGTAALLIDFYDSLFPGQALRSSGLKGLLIHTADDLGPAGPDYQYGWGLVNAMAAADLIQQHKDAPGGHFYQETQLTTGAVQTVSVFWDGSAPLRATLCWTDPAAASISGLDNTTPALVNDLDLRVVGPDGSTTYFPFKLDGANPSALAVAGDNTVDNVEQVLIPAGAPAGEYAVKVSNKNTLSGDGQWYALWVSGQAPSDIAVQPVDSFASAGPRGGPFDPSAKVYTITNLSGASVNYAVTADVSWLEASPTGGTLANGVSVDVTLSLNAIEAVSLGEGKHLATATFTNLSDGMSEERTAALTVRGVDAFAFGSVSSPQEVNAPFALDVEAVDSTGARVTAFAGSAALTAHAVESRAVGDGTAAWGYPLYTLYEDARLQTIYPAARAGPAGRIRALSLEVTQAPPLTLANWTLRMKHTTLTSYPASPVWESSGWTTVYQNDEHFYAAGWTRFDLSTPFDYNGVDNLMIDFSFNNASYFFEGQTRVAAAPAGEYPSIYWRSDSLDGDPLNWSGATPAPTRDSRYPILYLEFENPLPVAPASIGPFSAGLWSGMATVEALSGAAVLRAEDVAGHVGESDPFAVVNTAPPAIQFSHAASSVEESAGAAGLSVEIDRAPDSGTASVDYVVIGGSAESGSDYQLLGAGTLAFDEATSQAVSLSIQDDAVDEYDQTLIIQLADPVNCQIGPGDTHTLTIRDNDAPPDIGFGEAWISANETDGGIQLTVNLTGNATEKPVSIRARTESATASGGEDFTDVEQTLEFPPPAREAEFSAAILDDGLSEGLEAFRVVLDNATNATLDTEFIVVLIVDDEPPPNAARGWRVFR